MNQTAPCPKCKAFNGWFEKRVQSYRQYFDLNGNATHATDEGFNRGGKRKYCSECGREITDLIKP